jgi:hypothetical protein
MKTYLKFIFWIVNKVVIFAAKETGNQKFLIDVTNVIISLEKLFSDYKLNYPTSVVIQTPVVVTKQDSNIPTNKV